MQKKEEPNRAFKHEAARINTIMCSTLPKTVTHIFQSQLYCILAFMFAFYRLLHMKFRTVIVVLSVSIYFMSHLSVLVIMFSVTHAYVS